MNVSLMFIFSGNFYFETGLFPQDLFCTRHGGRFIVLYTNMAAVTSCENDLFVKRKIDRVCEQACKLQGALQNHPEL